MKTGIRGFVIAAAAVGVLAAGGATIAAGRTQDPARAAQPAAASDACVSEIDASGYRTWVGRPARALARAADDLQAFADEHPEWVAGVAFCSDYAAVEVLVKPGDDAVVTALDQAVAEHPGARVVVREVSYSFADLMAAQEALMTPAARDLGIIGAGPDLPGGGLVVVLAHLHDRAALDAVLAETGVPVRVTFGGQGTLAVGIAPASKR